MCGFEQNFELRSDDSDSEVQLDEAEEEGLRDPLRTNNCSPKWETALIFISRQRSLLRSCKLSYCGTVECAACSFCDKRSPLRISLRMLIPASLQGVRADTRPVSSFYRAWLSGWKARFFCRVRPSWTGLYVAVNNKRPPLQMRLHAAEALGLPALCILIHARVSNKATGRS